MIKYILLTMVTLLCGCEFLDYLVSPEGDTAVDGVKAVASGFGLPGVIGSSVFGLALGLYKDHRTKKSKIDMIKKLGADAYLDYRSMSETDKSSLDKSVRNMVPKKYQHHYDNGKNMLS